jgi:ABC-2 type transport system permease protein
MKLVRDTWLIFERSMWLTLHNPVWVIFGLMMPFLYLVLFGPLLESVVKAPGFPGGNAYNIFVPGLLIQIALFGGSFVGFGLIAEMRAGVVERMRVTPVSRMAMLLGRSLRDVVILVCQAIFLIILALPFGLHLDVPAMLVALGLLALIGLVMSPFSYTLALVLKSEDALAPAVNAIALPLLLLSGILLPMQLAPDWLKTIASFDPFSHSVDAIRALFNGAYGDPSVAGGVILMVVLAVASLTMAARTFGNTNA